MTPSTTAEVMRPAVAHSGRLSVILVGLVAMAALAGALLGEKVRVADGLGWDGAAYGSWARDYYNELFVKGTTATLAHRLFPSAIVHYTLRLLAVPLTTVNVIRAFALFNVILLSLTAWLWCRVADVLGVGVQGRWLGIIGLFANFAALKWLAYYPVLTDAYALAAGMFMLYCHLSGRRFALLLVTALGALTWPTLPIQSALLLLFPYNQAPTPPGRPRFALHVIAAAAVSLVVFAALLVLGHSGNGFRTPQQADYAGNFLRIIRPLGLVLLFSAALVALYLFLGLCGLWDRACFFDPRYWLRSFQARWLLPLAAVMLAARAVAGAATAEPAALGTQDVLAMFGWLALVRPGIAVVAHIVFFGPILWLAAFRYRAVCRSVQSGGPGLPLCFTYALLMGIESESRHLMHFFPILVAFVARAIPEGTWSARRLVAFGLFSLLFSRFWLLLGAEPDAGHFAEFPAQWLFMHLGPWMAPLTYRVQAVLVLVAAGVVYALLPRGVSAQTDCSVGARPTVASPGGDAHAA